MRQTIVFVALMSVASATAAADFEGNYVDDSKNPLQCVLDNTNQILEKTYKEFSEFLKSLNVKESAKGTIGKLREKRITLQNTLNNSAQDAIQRRNECAKKAEGSLFLNARCVLRAGAKFIFNSGVAVAHFSVDVATIITEDNVTFHGDNLKKAMDLTKKHTRQVAESVRNSIKCFQDRFQDSFEPYGYVDVY